MWNDNFTKNFILSLSSPFKRKSEINNISKSISKRENDPKFFIKRIKNQIIKVHKNNFNYSTPEEWDESFIKLGGGSGFRKSSSILKRMTWDQFLFFFEKVVKEEDNDT